MIAGATNAGGAVCFYNGHVYMVAGPGIEPGTVAYETTVLPLHYPAIDLFSFAAHQLQQRNEYVNEIQIQCQGS